MERVTISKIETGYREVTDVEAPLAIAKAMGVTISWLMGEGEDKRSSSSDFNPA